MAHDSYVAPPSVLATATRFAREARQVEEERLHAVERCDVLIEEIAVFVSHLRDDYLSDLQSVKTTARQIREQFLPRAIAQL